MIINNYYKNDLSYYYVASYDKNGNIEPESSNNSPTRSNLFRIFIVLEGNAKVQYNDTIFTMSANSLFIVEPNAIFGYRLPDKIRSRHKLISMHPSVYQCSEDENFYRAFYSLIKEQRMIDLSKSEFSTINFHLNKLDEYTRNNLGRDYIMSGMLGIISELALYTDRVQKNDNSHSDSLIVDLMEYIEQHYTEPITVSKVAEHFFVSESTIARIVKYKTGKSFGEYIENMRLSDAKNMLDNEFYHCTAKETAKLCGYPVYSTFYRAYLRRFGIPPTDKRKRDGYKNMPFKTNK